MVNLLLSAFPHSPQIIYTDLIYPKVFNPFTFLHNILDGKETPFINLTQVMVPHSYTQRVTFNCFSL